MELEGQNRRNQKSASGWGGGTILVVLGGSWQLLGRYLVVLGSSWVALGCYWALLVPSWQLEVGSEGDPGGPGGPGGAAVAKS